MLLILYLWFFFFVLIRKVDPYGFERSDDFDFESYEQFMSSYLSILARRAARWKDTYDDKRKISRSRKCKWADTIILMYAMYFLAG